MLGGGVEPPAALGSAEGERVGPFLAYSTPGHATDHVAFVLDEGPSGGLVVFCGDVVLGQGSTIVPPRSGGGSLADYLASLDLLGSLGASLMCPGHGPWIEDPTGKLIEYREHRLERERLLVEALESGRRSTDELLDVAWHDVPEAMRPAAALAMRAHLEKLEAEDRLPEGFRSEKGWGSGAWGSRRVVRDVVSLATEGRAVGWRHAYIVEAPRFGLLRFLSVELAAPSAIPSPKRHYPFGCRVVRFVCLPPYVPE